MITALENCLVCDSSVETCLDLGDQPLANAYLKHYEDEEQYFPLKLNFCKACSHLQLSHKVNPDTLFKHYLYVSGTSTTFKDYCDSFVELTKQYVSGNKVLDIACNDGTQLDSFKSKGYLTFGIDPAKNLYNISSKKHTVVCDYLTKESITSFKTKFDIIVAQNVFAHIDYIKDFLWHCKSCLTTNGRIFIQTSQANMVENGEFDTIYHEHLSFFSVKSFCALAKLCGLNVIDIKKPDIHGTSFVFILGNNGTDKSQELIQNYFKVDEQALHDYKCKVYKTISELKNTVNSYRQQGYSVVGYGAAAKGNTLLNACDIVLDYIADDNVLKQGLFTPGTRIPIVHPNKLSLTSKKLLVLPLAWNFYKEIKYKIKARNSEAILLTYFPEIKVDETTL